MNDREASMRTAKRQINSEKYERVIAVIAQIKEQGRDDQLKATVIARRAGVHRSFVSNHFAAQIAHAQAEIQSRFIAGLAGQTALSAVSLRVEMETAKNQAREAQIEIRALKTRLARSLGEEIASEHPEHSVSTATVQDLHAQIGQLLSGARRAPPPATRHRGRARSGATSEPHTRPRAQLRPDLAALSSASGPERDGREHRLRMMG